MLGELTGSENEAVVTESSISESEGSSIFDTLVVVVDGGLSKLVRKYDTGVCCPQSPCLGMSASNV